MQLVPQHRRGPLPVLTCFIAAILGGNAEVKHFLGLR
jgi:hypothetical protein